MSDTLTYLQTRDIVLTVLPSSVTILHQPQNAREHTTKRDVGSSLLKAAENPLMPIVMQEFNVTLPTSAGKYTRVFDTRLSLGRPHRLQEQSAEWLLPSSFQQMEAAQVFQLTSDKTILYLNDVVDVSKLNTSAVLRLKATASPTTSQGDSSIVLPDVLLSLTVTFETFQRGSCEKHRDIKCAEFLLDAECDASCGFNSGGSTSCQWVPEG